MREVRAIRAEHPTANILIYTEYADSQLAALRCALRGAIEGEVLAISGLDAERERTRIAERCAEEDGIILVSTDSLAEGLNLQQRCCNLIHLDLPYNPNRLEQRNGRIDRYGQERDPQIRYLYLAGTFEERLLLRLIAKYEKARAQLAFMPDTLGVTADEEAWSTRPGGRISPSGRQGLFDDEPSAIRTLDQAAEEANADAYRDLLHEIDRAFDGFDRSAVRHGWLADHGLNADAAQMAAGGPPRGGAAMRLLGHVDLPDFVAAAIAAETGGSAAGRRVLQSSCRLACGARWICRASIASTACSVSRATATRVARRAGPLAGVSRPCASGGAARHLPRAAYRRRGMGQSSERGAGGSQCARAAVLLTFSVEMRSAARTEFQRIIAVLLPAHGDAVEVNEPERWLQLGGNGSIVAYRRMCGRRCLRIGCRIARREAESVASAAMQRDAVQVQRRDHQRESRARSGRPARLAAPARG